MFETLTMEQAGPVATVWMARPEVFNAFNEQLIEELTRACAVLEQDIRVRVVVLGGRGLHFSAGAPLAQKAAKELIAAVHGQPLDDGTCKTRRNALRASAARTRHATACRHSSTSGPPPG